MSLVRRALFFSFLGKYSSLVLDFISVIIIARVLSPEDLGGYSLAAGSIVIGHMLRDFGLSLYIIKEKDLTLDKIQGCFTIAITLCWSIAAIYFFSSDFIGEFFGNSQISLLVKILSISFIFLPFGPIMISLLKRELKFEKIMVVSLTGTFVTTASTLCLLYLSYGVISIAIGVVLGSFTAVLFAVYLGEWRYYRLNFKYVIEIGRFTSFVSISNVLGQMKSIIPEVMIGKALSVEQVAYFGKGIATLNLFATLILSVVGSVVQPYIAKLKNSDQETNTSIYMIINSVLVLQWPFCAFVILFSSDLVHVLYGPQWEASVQLTKIFAVFLFIDGFVVMGDALLNAIGEVKFIFKFTLASTVARIALVFIFVEDGLVAIALSFTALTFFRLFVLFPKLYSSFNLNWKPLVGIYTKNAALAAIVILVGFIFSPLTEDLNLYVRFVLNSLLIGSVWLASVFLLKHDFRFRILEVFTLLKNKLSATS